MTQNYFKIPVNFYQTFEIRKLNWKNVVEVTPFIKDYYSPRSPFGSIFGECLEDTQAVDEMRLREKLKRWHRFRMLWKRQRRSHWSCFRNYSQTWSLSSLPDWGIPEWFAILTTFRTISSMVRERFAWTFERQEIHAGRNGNSASWLHRVRY